DTVDRFKFHARRNLRAGSNRIGGNFTHNRTHTRDTDDKHQPVGENSEDEVSYRTGSNDGGALTHRFVVERKVAHFWRNGFDALIEHFDITAKRNEGNDKLSPLAIGAAPE